MTEGGPKILIRSLDMALGVDNDVTVVYFIRDLKKVHIDVRDDKQGKINLQEFMKKAFDFCSEHWDGYWGQALAPALYMLHVRQVHGHFPSGDGVTMAWEQAFAFGIILERLRSKYNLSFEVVETTLTPEQLALELGEDDE